MEMSRAPKHTTSAVSTVRVATSSRWAWRAAMKYLSRAVYISLSSGSERRMFVAERAQMPKSMFSRLRAMAGIVLTHISRHWGAGFSGKGLWAVRCQFCIKRCSIRRRALDSGRLRSFASSGGDAGWVKMFSLFAHRGQLGRTAACSGVCAAGDSVPVLTAWGERPDC